MFQDLQLEVTSHCNLRCPFCPEGKMKRPQGHMSLDLATQILDEVRKKRIAKNIYFHTMGEPLLNPQIKEIVQYAAKHFEETHFFTNLILWNESRMKEMIQTGLSHLHLSVQSHDNPSFAMKFRDKPSMDYEQAIERVARTIRYLKEEKNDVKVVKIRHLGLMGKEFKLRSRSLGRKASQCALVNDENIETVLRRYLISAGKPVAAAAKETAEVLFEWKRGRSLSHEIAPNIFFQMMPSDTWGNQINDEPVPHLGRFGRCRSIVKDETLSVSWDGRVIFCCSDYDFENSVGTIRKDGSLFEIIRNEKATRFRKWMKRGIILSPRCQKCMGGYDRTRLLMRNAASFMVPQDSANSF